MRRREFLTLVGGAAAWPVVARAQDRPRIGFLSPASGPGPNHTAFLRQLKADGFEEGKTVDIVWKFTHQQYDKLPEAAAEVTKQDIRVLATQTQAAALAAQKATKTIPIVFMGVRDPIFAGLVKSMAQPEANITGATLTASWQTAAKQVEILKELVPRVSKIGILWNPDVLIQARAIEEIKNATQLLSISFRSLGVSKPGDIEQAFIALSTDRVDGIITLVEFFTYAQRGNIAMLAAEAKIPTVFEAKDYVEAGGLFSYGIKYHEMFAQGASYVARILKGAKPSELPVVDAAHFELVINLKTAKALGLTTSARAACAG